MTPNKICTQIEQLTTHLLTKEIALHANVSQVLHRKNNIKQVTWINNTPSTNLDFTTIAEYRWFIEHKQYLQRITL